MKNERLDYDRGFMIRNGYIASDLFYRITRDLKEGEPLVITELGGDGDTAEEIYREGTAFWYGNQYLVRKQWETEDDRFGRNRLDCTFIALCLEFYLFHLFPDFDFKSLTARKEGDDYFVRMQYNNVDIEYELTEAFSIIRKQLP